MINSNVSNADRTESYIAFVLDDVINLNLTSKSRLTVETAVKLNSTGSVTAGRYFLQKGASATTLVGLPKTMLHKRRCCSISKRSIDTELLQKLEEGVCIHVIPWPSS